MQDKLFRMISEMTGWNILLGISIIGLGFAVLKIRKYTIEHQQQCKGEDDCLTLPAAELYNEDQLTEEEYKKIKERMAQRLKEKDQQTVQTKKSSEEKLAELKKIVQNHARNKDTNLSSPDEKQELAIQKGQDQIITATDPQTP